MKEIDKKDDQQPTVSQEALQTYYKEAYMRERERFNSMFGALEYNPVYEAPIYQEATPEQPVETEPMVPQIKLKKARRALAVFVILTIGFLGAAAYFAAKVFELI
jgi:hypothetical protein